MREKGEQVRSDLFGYPEAKSEIRNPKSEKRGPENE